MTNHIEQLMKAAGVSKYSVNIHNTNDNHIYWTELHYPAFTPARQLELIKLLAERKGYSGIGEQIDYFTEIYGLTFENAIAQITSNAISSKILNKSEVKRILEDDTNL